MDMTDSLSDYFLGRQQLSYLDQGLYDDFEAWSGTAFLLSPTAATIQPNSLDDIENIYTGLHMSVDKVVAEISIRTPPRLDQIREQNRKLIDKLTSLQSAITGDSTAAVNGTQSRRRSLASNPTQDRVYSKRQCVSQSTNLRTANISVLSMPTEAQAQNKPPENQPSSHGISFSNGEFRLVKKLLQISTPEARTQVAEFAAQRKAPEYSKAQPNMYQFSSMSQFTDASHFLRLVVDLGLVIERSMFGEQSSRIRKRIALAHFYHAYTLAQDNPTIFLTWCDDRRVQCGSLLPKGGHKSLVQHRFADLIFSRSEKQGGMSSSGPTSSGDDVKKRTTKIQIWRKSGKKWAQIIQRFGYGILLLLPSSISDEELRVAHDNVVAYCLDLIDSRKPLFADALQQANELLDTHFFPRDANSYLSNMRSSSRPEAVNWDDLLNSPIIVD